MRSRLSLRMQLTLLYAVPFLVTGAVLLSIPLFGVSRTSPVPGQTGGQPGEPHDTVIHGPVVTASAIAFGIMVVLSLVLGWLIAGRFLRPLRTITATAREISASNLDRRVGLKGRRDEFRDLAETLDDLFGRLQTSFESQRHFVANASHELRTPLTAERTLLQVALADPGATADSLRIACQEVLTLGAQQERLIDSLLTLASSEQGIEQREVFDLADVARSVVAARHPENGIHLACALAPAPVAGDPHLVESLLANLVDNALRYNVPGGRVEITTSASTVTVRNTGPVVPAGEVERLFQPFQQLGRERLRHADGYGLGLAIVSAIARAHGATLTPSARAEGGLEITVQFAAAGPSHPEAPPVPTRGRGGSR
jgi:signal transduction histidine kinase